MSRSCFQIFVVARDPLKSRFYPLTIRYVTNGRGSSAPWIRHDGALLIQLEKGATVDAATTQKDINWWGPPGTTAPLVAASRGHVEAITLLVKQGADVNLANKDGQTPTFRAAENGHANAIKALQSMGADLHKPNNDGVTPLAKAVEEGHD